MTMLGLNQATCGDVPTSDFLEISANAGFDAVSLWRHKVDDGGHARVRRACDSLGLRISSLCRGGFFTTGSSTASDCRSDNHRAIDEAAALGAPLLVLVCGPTTDGDLPAARTRIRSGVEQVLDYAAQAGVGLAIEPFHPMLAAERSALITLRQANDLLDQIAHPSLSIALDTYHVWWDPDLPEELPRASGRVSIVQVADWMVPTTSLLRGRGLPGDGVIRLASLMAAIGDAGFAGCYEVEVISDVLDQEPPEAVATRAYAAMRGLLGFADVKEA